MKCAAFYRNILSAVNDLADLDSENTLQNPAIVCQIVRKLPVQVKDKWWEMVHHIDGKTLTDKEKPAKFIQFIKWQLEIADEMTVSSPTSSKFPSNSAQSTH